MTTQQAAVISGLPWRLWPHVERDWQCRVCRHVLDGPVRTPAVCPGCQRTRVSIRAKVDPGKRVMRKLAPLPPANDTGRSKDRARRRT